MGNHCNFRVIDFTGGHVEVESPFAGTIIAPHGRLELSSVDDNAPVGFRSGPNYQPGHHGAFYAREVEIHQGNKVWFYPYQPWRSF